jgi:lycopene beta-cyclase
VDVDVAIIGAGGGGLSLVLALERALQGRLQAAPRIALIDPAHRATNDRTWCWWARTPDPLEELLYRSWPRMELRDGQGIPASYELAPDRYVMLRSADFYAAAERALVRLGAVRIRAAAGPPQELAGSVTVPAGDVEVRANWAFDSRPAPRRRPGGTFWLQHFRGWFVRFPAPALEAGLATLMDFSVPQPDEGVAFAYCLPLAADRALVEYTEFSPQRLPSDRYDQALREYLRRRWPELAAGITVEEVEDGAIPMSDAPCSTRAGERTFRLGSAGGATRASTGYTFAAMQRQAEAVAAALLAGAVPVPPPAYPARHRWMDAVLLRALRTGAVNGPDLFTRLFAGNPPSRMISFLDGVSSLPEDLAVMRCTPAAAMARAALADAGSRVTHRLVRSVVPRNSR